MENGSPILGDPNAPITLIEFGDYQCYFCNQFFHTTEDSLFKNYVETGKVKVIFKDFTIIGSDSVTAAHAAHCADDQGLFWEYHDTLYDHWTGENNGWASSENLLQFAGDVGLNIDEFSKCMIDSKHSPTIVNSNQDAKDLGLTGTPAFFIIGPDNKVTKIGGAQPYDVFERIFNSELEK
jgi:protein-disulfide isomerase